MNQLSSLGLILLLALLAGHLVKFLRIPEVSGYLLAGMALGPSVLGWITEENLSTLSVFSEVALGLILFSIGSVFDFSRFQKVGKRIVLLALLESSLAAVLVVVGTLLNGAPWQVALLLGSIAVETAAASTLMVLREANASGPLSDTLLGIIAVDNVFCLLGFSLIATFVELTESDQANAFEWDSLVRAIFPLVWQVVGSVALGYLVGLLLAGWSSTVVEHGEILILMMGCVLLCVGISILLELSPLLASLSVGATMVNLSARSRTLFRALAHTDPPLYAIFFVLAGSDLNVSLLGSIGMLGTTYVLCRIAGKFFGAHLGARWLEFDRPIQRLLGFGMITQAGLAIGIMLTIHRRFPEYSSLISAVVLSSIILFEMMGPIATRFAVLRAGEARTRGVPTPIGSELPPIR